MGGLVLLAFVVNNGFLPELDLSGTVSLLASVSLVSLFLIFVIFMLTTVGGWIICSWFEKWNAKLRGLTAMLFAMLSAAMVYAGLAVMGESPAMIRNIAAGVLVLLAICCGIRGRQRYRAVWNARPQQFFWKELGLMAAALFIGMLFAIYNALVFVKMYRVQPGIDDVAQWVGFGAWLIAQAMCIGLVAFCETLATRLKMSVSLGTVGLVLLLILSNNPSFLVDRMAKVLGIGALTNVSLAVTLEGCQVLNVLSEGDLCVPVLNKSVYVIRPLTLRSRFGKQVLIEYSKLQEGEVEGFRILRI